MTGTKLNIFTPALHMMGNKSVPTPGAAALSAAAHGAGEGAPAQLEGKWLLDLDCCLQPLCSNCNYHIYRYTIYGTYYICIL